MPLAIVGFLGALLLELINSKTHIFLTLTNLELGCILQWCYLVFCHSLIGRFSSPMLYNWQHPEFWWNIVVEMEKLIWLINSFTFMFLVIFCSLLCIFPWSQPIVPHPRGHSFPAYRLKKVHQMVYKASLILNVFWFTSYCLVNTFAFLKQKITQDYSGSLHFLNWIKIKDSNTDCSGGWW